MSNTLYNPFTGTDEIVVRDAQGGMSVVRADAASPAPTPAPSGLPPAPVVLRPITPPPLPASLPPRLVAVEGDDLAVVCQRLAAAAGVTLDDPGLVRRLANVVVSRVKDIRGQIEMLEILRRPVKVGGLGIESAAAEKLGRIIELQLPKLVGRSWAIPPPPPPAVAVVTRPATVIRPSLAVAAGVPPPSRFQPTPAAPTAFIPPRTSEGVPPPAPVRPVAAAAPASPPARPMAQWPAPAPAPVTPPPVARPMPLPPATPPPMVAPQLAVAQPVIPSPIVRVAQPAAAPAPSVSPVASFAPPPGGERAAPRGGQAQASHALVGTVEELGRFTLVDFRHLDPSPAIAAAKVHALFTALERESFARRAAGLSAWRSSELYALYTAMGSESMVAKQPMEAVAAQRVARGQPALTVAEFEAIMDLNQQLRF